MSLFKKDETICTLYLKGNLVGFEKWLLGTIPRQTDKSMRKTPVLCMYHSIDGVHWGGGRLFPKPPDDCGSILIMYDEKKISQARVEKILNFFKCPNCNNVDILKGFNFCPSCGVSLEWK